MMKGKTFFCVGTLAMTTIGVSAQMAPVQDDGHQIKLEEVVVTGTRTEKRLSEVPVLTTVISEKDIRKSGVQTALEALEDNLPGIVSEANAMGNNLRIKGLSSRYILFLVDGERMVSEGAGGNINLSQIDVNSIKRIEIINGAASALYGSNAVGAVVNIITKQPTERLETGAEVRLESHNTLSTKANVSFGLNKLKSLISGFRNTSDGFGGNGNGPYAARYEDWGGNLKLMYQLSKRVDINLTGRYFRHETFNPTGSLNSSHPLTHTFSTGLNGGYTSAEGKYRMCASVNFSKYFDMDYLERLSTSRMANNVSYISSRVTNTFTPTEKWEIVTGMEQNHEQTYATRTLGAVPTSKSLDDFNVFGQAQYTMMTNLDLIAGARYTYNNQFHSAFTPKLSMMYRQGRFTFRGGIGTAFRSPSIKELYYNFDHQGMFWVYGNKNLKAEKGVYSSLSAEYTQKDFNASLTCYWNHIDQKITRYEVVNQMGGNERYYKNVSSASLKGIDMNVSYVLYKQLVVKGSYSFCNACDNSTGLQLSSNVKHSGTVSFTWNGNVARSPFSLQLAGRMTSPKLYQKMVTDENGQQHEESTQSKSYNIWKMTLVKPFLINRHTVEFTAKCDNLFNFKESSFINPGRQYMIGLRYAFK